MRASKRFWRKLLRRKALQERGSALIIVTLILALLTIYVSASLTITTTDTVSSNFEVAQQRAYYSAFAKLEQMSRDFSTLFVTSPSPTNDSLCRIVVAPPDVLNNFRVVKPNVDCSGSGCVPGGTYTKNDYESSNVFDLGWVGQANFCIVDVCNPNASGCTILPRPPYPVQITSGTYQGLQAFTRQYREVATVTNNVRGGAGVQLTRDFTNYLLPLFQFGIFTDSDFELYNPPNWQFGGWIHTNGDFYLTRGAGNSNRFSQYVATATGVRATPARISVGKHVVINATKYGASGGATGDNDMTVVTDNMGGVLTYNQGSAFNGGRLTTNCNGVPLTKVSADAPNGNCVNAPIIAPNRAVLNGTATITVNAPRLQLPIQNILNANPIQLIRRGIASDLNPSLSSPYFGARYYYKPTLRVTLADYQTQLPRTVMTGQGTDPTSATGPYGGVELDAPDAILGQLNLAGVAAAMTVKVTNLPATGPNWSYMNDNTTNSSTGTAPAAGPRPLPRGYVPKVVNPDDGTPRPMGARLNGYRIHGWIKIEIVRTNGETRDITQEILNLGVTVPYSANRTPGGANPNGFYYPRPIDTSAPANGNMPVAAYRDRPLAFGDSEGAAFPDENSIIHLQRFAVPYTDQRIGAGGTALPTSLTDNLIPQGLENVNTSIIDYYSSMSRRNTTVSPGSGLNMFGIEDNPDNGVPTAVPPVLPRYRTRDAGATTNLYSEPQNDQAGYRTDEIGAPTPLQVSTGALKASVVDFTGGTPGTSRNGTNMLAENTNTPKKAFDRSAKPAPSQDDVESVAYREGETTWLFNKTTTVISPAALPANSTTRTTDLARLVPFPINMYDSREGTPHEPNTVGAADPPVPGLLQTAVNRVGTMNLVEIDMGNLGRLLRGDFDQLFRQMGTTPYSTLYGPLTGLALRENITINQDNGWLVYISDRRGDEPVLSTRQNNPVPGAPSTSMPNTPSLIGDGEYHREDIVWNTGGNTGAGNPSFVPVAMGANFGCTAPFNSDNQDLGKSPQDANNDCVIQRETNGFSESAAYNQGFFAGTTAEDQYDGARTYANNAPGGTTQRLGNMIAMTQVPTNRVNQVTWTTKPPVMFANAANQRIELFRRAVRLVNASTLFPVVNGVGAMNGQCGFPSGITLISENPVYVLGNYNVPAAEVGDTGDIYPGLVNPPPAGQPTSPLNYQGSTFSTSVATHVPSAIVADAISLLSNPSVGTSNPMWSSAANGAAGWLDSRSFVAPYQSIRYRPARNTVYRFALLSGFTPSWLPSYWTTQTGTDVTNIHQGNASKQSSGALNNFPRFLEDWAQNGTSTQFATYAGSLIRIFKSTQGNGAFKRVSSASTTTSFTAGGVDYVYRPPNRDWIFDTDYNNPCTLPPGSPFLQLVDFKGFQQSQVQRQKQ